MEKNREIIKFDFRYEIAPILNEFSLENEEFEQHNECYDSDSNRNEHILWDLWDSFDLIEVDTYNYDLEKGYEEKYSIVERKSDGKYFRGTWLNSHYCENDYDLTLTEVFPKQIMKTIYE